MIGGLPSLIYKMFFLQIGVFAMTATFFRFVVALLFWISFPLVIVAALAPEESTEFDGQKVTDFGLQARDGRMLDVRDFRGRPVIVEFFASGSPACHAQLEQLIELHHRYAHQGLTIFALAVDRFETPETDKDVGPLILTRKLPFPVGAATRDLANDYHYKGVPATIVLDGEGKIGRIFFGFHEMEKIEPIIKTLLATKK
jgi:thiol-disulfide isomerase/thioredoxin